MLPAPASHRQVGTRYGARLRAAFGVLSGAGSVGAGVVVAGVCTYLFLSISARAVGPARFAPISTLWALVLIFGPGLFLPVQQELGRVLAGSRVDRAGGNAARRALLISGGMLSVVVAAAAALGPWLTRALFAGSWGLFGCFLGALSGFSLAYLARGILSGLGEFGDLGRLIVGEAFARMAFVAVLAAAGVRSVGAYGAAVAVAPFVAVGVVTRAGRRLSMPAGAMTPWGDLTTALGWLLVGSVLAQLVANVGPAAVQLLETPGDRTQAGRFLAALVIARVSLFLFQAIQATILPNLSALVAERRLGELRAAVRRLTWAAGALVLVCTVGAFVAGPLVVRVMFGSRFPIGHTTMAVLAGASAVYILAATLNGAAIAAAGHRTSALAWLVGCAGFATGTLVVKGLFLRVEIGYLVGSCAAAAVLLASMRGLTAKHRRLPAALSQPAPPRLDRPTRTGP